MVEKTYSQILKRVSPRNFQSLHESPRWKEDNPKILLFLCRTLCLSNNFTVPEFRFNDYFNTKRPIVRSETFIISDPKPQTKIFHNYYVLIHVRQVSKHLLPNKRVINIQNLRLWWVMWSPCSSILSIINDAQMVHNSWQLRFSQCISETLLRVILCTSIVYPLDSDHVPHCNFG